MSFFRKHTLPAALCALGLIALSLLLLTRPFNRAPEPEAFSAACAALNQGGYFTFQETCYLETQGEKREYFLLSGEKAAPDCRLQGRILGTEANLWLVEDVLYQQLSDGTWLINPFPDVKRTASLFAELDPCAMFLPGGSISGELKKDGKLWYGEYVPDDTGWLGEYFTDMRYGLWLDKEGRLKQGELTATLKEDGESLLTLTLFIPEYRDNLVIAPPEMEAPAPAKEVPGEEQQEAEDAAQEETREEAEADGAAGA